MADPTNAKLAGQANTLFKGRTAARLTAQRLRF